MKKFFYYAFASLLALGAVACDDDTKTPHKSLSASPLKLEFTATPETAQTIAVEAENVRWKASTQADWLTLTGEEGTADGTIRVTALPNETTDPLSATIVIRAEGGGVDDVTVTVTQQAGEPVISEPTIIWERSSRSRMNFQGDVKTASTFGLYINNTWENIDDLRFDDAGMLTSFSRIVSGQTVVYTLAYDAQNRLIGCSWNDGEGNKSFELTYGTHEQYIYTETLFNDISFAVGVTNFTLWLPRYIKNLETVVCRVPSYEDPSIADVITYSVEVTGDTGKIYAQENDSSKDEYAELGFTNGFTTKTVSLGYFGSTTDYTVNPENGNLLQYVSDDGYSTITVKYNNDRINTLAEILGDISTKMEYYENLDVKSVTDPGDGSKSEMTYQFDNRGNWTKMTVTGADAGTIERSLTYDE